MIVFASPIAVGNINRLRVSSVALDDEAGRALVRIQAGNAGFARFTRIEVLVSNTSAQVIGKNPSTTSYGDDVVLVGEISLVAGYDRIEAAYRGGGTKAAAYRALETLGIADGWIHASLVGDVS